MNVCVEYYLTQIMTCALGFPLMNHHESQWQHEA